MINTLFHLPILDENARRYKNSKVGQYQMDPSNIPLYIKIGMKDKDWYIKCQQLFEDLFGKENLMLVCRLFAATSINTSLKANVTLFRKAYYEIKHNLPVGDYLPNIYNQIVRIRQGLELSGPKINSFARAMYGDVMAVVVDIWLLRAFGIDRKYFRSSGPHDGTFRSAGATDKEYSLIEAWVRREAFSMGLQPRELSSIIWAGVRIHQGGDRQTHYEELLRYNFNNLFQVI